MIGGAVSGAILGAIDGGLEGALRGAAWGAGIGGILGAGYGMGLGGYFAAGVAIGGAAYAGATGGLEGLGDFAAGAIGAYYGHTLGTAIVDPSQYTQTQAETQAQERRINNMMEMLDDGQLENPMGNMNDGTSITLGNTEKANVIRDAAVKGAIGKGNNPKIPQKITLIDEPGPLPSRSELFWRGVAEDLQVYGKSAVKIGTKMATVGKVFSLHFSPFKAFGAVMGGAGKIDVSVGNFMEFIGRGMDARFPDPYW